MFSFYVTLLSGKVWSASNLDDKSKLLHPDASVSLTASCQSGSFCLASSWADRERMKGHTAGNGLSLWKKCYDVGVTWHDFSDGVTFLSSFQYVDDPLKNPFQQWARTSCFHFFLAITIKSQLKILFPRDLHCWSVETTHLLVLSWPQTSTPWHHYRDTLHCLVFPIDDTESFCLFTS